MCKNSTLRYSLDGMIGRTDGMNFSDACSGRQRRVPRGSCLAPVVEEKSSGISLVFATDLFFSLAVYCGSSTVGALLHVSSAALLSWKRLPIQSKWALQWGTAIVGSSVQGAWAWDRLCVFSESGYRLQSYAIPKPRCFTACVFDGSHLIYFLGGGRESQSINGDHRPRGCAMDSFDMHACTWAVEPALITARMQCEASRLGNEILAMGGFCGTTFDFQSLKRRDILDSIEAFDLTDRSWQRRNVLLYRRHAFALTNVACNLYVIGGITYLPHEPAEPDGTRRLRACDSVEVISESGKTVRAHSTMPVPVSGCHAVVVGHRILVFGGWCEPDRRSASGIGSATREPVQELNSLTGIWTTLRDPPGRIPDFDPLLFERGICVHTGTFIRIFGGVFFGVEMEVELVTDESVQKWRAKRSRWGFATGVAVSLTSM